MSYFAIIISSGTCIVYTVTISNYSTLKSAKYYFPCSKMDVMLMLRAYLDKLTWSEYNCFLVGSNATIAGFVFGLLVLFGASRYLRLYHCECRLHRKLTTVTVKLYIKTNPRDQQKVVLIHRWSLYAGSIAWKVYAGGHINCGLYKQMIFIYRWSLEQVRLYMISQPCLHIWFHIINITDWLLFCSFLCLLVSSVPFFVSSFTQKLSCQSVKQTNKQLNHFINQLFHLIFSIGASCYVICH